MQCEIPLYIQEDNSHGKGIISETNPLEDFHRNMGSSGIQALAFIGGVLSEILIFCKGEWDLQSPKIVRSYLALQLCSIALITATGSSLSASVWETTKLSASYFVGLFGAIVTYRLFFHPLRSYPGPLGARISALWLLKQNFSHLMFYRSVPQLHSKYGDFVRIRMFVFPYAHCSER